MLAEMANSCGKRWVLHHVGRPSMFRSHKRMSSMARAPADIVWISPEIQSFGGILKYLFRALASLLRALAVAVDGSWYGVPSPDSDRTVMMVDSPRTV